MAVVIMLHFQREAGEKSTPIYNSYPQLPLIKWQGGRRGGAARGRGAATITCSVVWH